MKANLEKNQILALAGVGILLLAAGMLGWLGLGELGKQQEQAQALADRMGNPALAALLANPGGASRGERDAAEIQKLAQELRNGDLLAAGWAQATRELTGAGADWAQDPGKWKDRLIAAQSQLQKDAVSRRVEISPDFYLGLEAYRQKSPSAEEVPELALHLAVAERLVKLFLQAREFAEQYPTACTFLALTGPGSSPQEETTKPPTGKPGTPAVVVEKKKFRLQFRCSPEVLYGYLKLLAKDTALLVVTDLALTNEQQKFPLRSEIAKRFAQPELGETEGGKGDPKLLEILAGEESLNTSMELDFIVWKDGEPAKPGSTSP